MALKQKSQTLRPFGLRDQMGYLAGNFAGDFTYTLCTAMILITHDLGIAAG